MKITDEQHFNNEVKLTLENTEVLYNTALYIKPFDMQGHKQLAEEVIVQMQDNGVEISNFIDASDKAFPVVVNTVEAIQAEAAA